MPTIKNQLFNIGPGTQVRLNAQSSYGDSVVQTSHVENVVDNANAYWNLANASVIASIPTFIPRQMPGLAEVSVIGMEGNKALRIIRSGLRHAQAYPRWLASQGTFPVKRYKDFNNADYEADESGRDYRILSMPVVHLTSRVYDKATFAQVIGGFNNVAPGSINANSYWLIEPANTAAAGYLRYEGWNVVQQTIGGGINIYGSVSFTFAWWGWYQENKKDGVISQELLGASVTFPTLPA